MRGQCSVLCVRQEEGDRPQKNSPRAPSARETNSWSRRDFLLRIPQVYQVPAFSPSSLAGCAAYSCREPLVCFDESLGGDVQAPNVQGGGGKGTAWSSPSHSSFRSRRSRTLLDKMESSRPCFTPVAEKPTATDVPRLVAAPSPSVSRIVSSTTSMVSSSRNWGIMRSEQ